MTVAAGLLAALAGWLLVPPARGAARGGAATSVGRRGSRTARWTAAVAGAVLAVVTVGAVVGRSAGVVAVVVLLVGGGLGQVVLGRRRTRARDRLADEVARACSALAQELAIGRVPAAALRAAATDFPVLRPAASVVAVGGDVVGVWADAAREPGAGGLGRLARAWRVAEASGAPLASTLEAVAARLRADREVGAVVESELAAARMTGRVLTALPVAGLGLGFLIGGDPLGFLLGHWIGQACLVGGTALATGGLLWTERLGRG